MLCQSDYHPIEIPDIELVATLPKMNQISSWAIPYGRINLTFLEDPNRPENRVLFRVICGDGIVYIVQTKPLGCRSFVVE